MTAGLTVLCLDADPSGVPGLDGLHCVLGSSARWPQRREALESPSAEGPVSGHPNDEVTLLVAAERAALEAALHRSDWPSRTADAAVVVYAPGATEAQAHALLRNGVQDVVTQPEASVVRRALRFAATRKNLERSARRAYATDLATGLPHEAQWIEHISHLLALRERDPSPMVLMALRVQGFDAVTQQLGAEAASVLRRKLAVRLRGALRAGDVVASVGAEGFGVLLGHIDTAAHADRVAAKLAGLVRQPIAVQGVSFTLEPSVGVAVYPEHGKKADVLLSRAMGQAMQVASVGDGTLAQMVRRVGPKAGAAAND